MRPLHIFNAPGVSIYVNEDIIWINQLPQTVGFVVHMVWISLATVHLRFLLSDLGVAWAADPFLSSSLGKSGSILLLRYLLHFLRRYEVSFARIYSLLFCRQCIVVSLRDLCAGGEPAD